MPVIEAIREQGVLRRFPGRTETDLYLWLAVHRAALEHALDWDMGSEAAVARLGADADLGPEAGKGGRLSQLWPALRQRLRRRGAKPMSAWAEGRKMARYSSTLFADLLVWLEEGGRHGRMLDTALLVAERELAHLHILHPGLELEEEQIRQVTEDASHRGGGRPGVSASAIAGEPGAALAERAPLVDLVIASRRTLRDAGVFSDASWAQAGRPLLVGPLPQDGPARLLLDLTGRADPQTAIFVAVYLAERWQLPLLLRTPAAAGADLEGIQAYFALHEVEARSVKTIPADAEEATLLIRGMWLQRRLRRPRLDPVAAERVQNFTGAVLLCP